MHNTNLHQFTKRKILQDRTWCWALNSSSLMNCFTISSVNLLKESSPMNDPKSSIEYRGVAGAVNNGSKLYNQTSVVKSTKYSSEVPSDLFLPETLPSSEVTDTLSSCFLARLRWLSDGRMDLKLRSISSSVMVSSRVLSSSSSLMLSSFRLSSLPSALLRDRIEESLSAPPRWVSLAVFNSSKELSTKQCI